MAFMCDYVYVHDRPDARLSSNNSPPANRITTRPCSQSSVAKVVSRVHPQSPLTRSLSGQMEASTISESHSKVVARMSPGAHLKFLVIHSVLLTYQDAYFALCNELGPFAKDS
jgi:hypothetical protein